MADITANVDAWSTTEGSNSPSGSTTIGTGLDDNLRAIQTGVALWLSNFGYADNFALAASVGSNALTISLKGKDGNDPSSTNKVRIPFRNATVATGDYAQVVVSTATSLVISSGSTMGAVSAIPFRLWIVGFNDAGTFRLGAINCLSSSAGAGSGRDVTAIYPLSAHAIASSTAEGGAGAADSAQVFYTGTAVTSKAYTVLGYMTWESGLTTAGTWDAVPTRIQRFSVGVPLPGRVLQIQRTDTGAVSTGSTTTPSDDTIPQITEGNQFMTQAITPSSTANVLRVFAQAVIAVDGSQTVTSALHQDAVSNALKATFIQTIGTGQPIVMPISHQMLAATTSATTFRNRIGGGGAGTWTFNGTAGGRALGGVMNSYMEAIEVMG